MLLPIKNTNVVCMPVVDYVQRAKILAAGLAALCLSACYPVTDEETYELHLKCEVLSRGEGLVRAQMEEHHASRLDGFNDVVKFSLDADAKKIGKRSEDVRKEGEAYLNTVSVALSQNDDKVIREAVTAIELCISGVYD